MTPVSKKTSCLILKITTSVDKDITTHIKQTIKTLLCVLQYNLRVSLLN
jgi:hypothetical protein